MISVARAAAPGYILLMTHNKPTKNEVLAIIETYEGLIRQGNKAAFAKWTEWKAVLVSMG